MLERDVTVRLQQRHLRNGDLRLPEVVCVAADDTADAVIEDFALDAVPENYDMTPMVGGGPRTNLTAKHSRSTTPYKQQAAANDARSSSSRERRPVVPRRRFVLTVLVSTELRSPLLLPSRRLRRLRLAQLTQLRLLLLFLFVDAPQLLVGMLACLVLCLYARVTSSQSMY